MAARYGDTRRYTWRKPHARYPHCRAFHRHLRFYCERSHDRQRLGGLDHAGRRDHRHRFRRRHFQREQRAWRAGKSPSPPRTLFSSPTSVTATRAMWRILIPRCARTSRSLRRQSCDGRIAPAPAATVWPVTSSSNARQPVLQQCQLFGSASIEATTSGRAMAAALRSARVRSGAETSFPQALRVRVRRQHRRSCRSCNLRGEDSGPARRACGWVSGRRRSGGHGRGGNIDIEAGSLPCGRGRFPPPLIPQRAAMCESSQRIHLRCSAEICRRWSIILRTTRHLCQFVWDHGERRQSWRGEVANWRELTIARNARSPALGPAASGADFIGALHHRWRGSLRFTGVFAITRRGGVDYPRRCGPIAHPRWRASPVDVRLGCCGRYL